MTSEELVRDGAFGVAEAQRFSGLGRTKLYELMEQGRLPFSKVGTRRLIPKNALVRILAEGLGDGPEGFRK